MRIQVDYLSNRLTVRGTPGDVATARALLVDGATDSAHVIGFGKAVPLPEADGYGETAVRAWGCWGDPIDAMVMEDEAESFSVTFDTAQGAPVQVAEAVSRRLPDAAVTLDCAWGADPRAVSATGRWIAGSGELAKVEGTREQYLHVRPRTEDWELDELFPVEGPSPN